MRILLATTSGAGHFGPLLSFGAALRALGYFMSAAPAGLGFLPVLVGPERRGLHDRLAHTRVVRT